VAVTSPYEQHHYLGEFASDGDALTDIQNNEWDSNGNGTGDPQQGMAYYNTTSDRFRYYDGVQWATFGPFDVDTILVNQDGDVLSNADGNVLVTG
jgi:hypothetical protein